MSWRVANSLETLRHQLDAPCPGRSVTADGGVGDAAHPARGSDNDDLNPCYGPDIATAHDCTHVRWRAGREATGSAPRAVPTTPGSSSRHSADVPFDAFIDDPAAWLPGVDEF
ncbi:hypothetical protein [Streptomyces sp. NK08204]|uniref:hypothetical protein n=1 Tax=Streptomyces sp. NK08204 TaxID=2873260 RepID=UPI001CED0C2A|nr:hypothetical protein [Streptomyces sp. NK08204]